MREFKGIQAKLITALCVIFCLYHLFQVGGVYSRLGIHMSSLPYRAGSLGFILLLVFLLHPVNKGAPKDRVPWYEFILILAGVGACWYFLFFPKQLLAFDARAECPTFVIILFFSCLIAVLEAGRRTVGLPLCLIAIVLMFYLFFCEYAPGPLKSAFIGIEYVTLLLYLSPSGIFGLAMGVASTIIVVFIIFSQLLFSSGASTFFLNLALGLFGHVRGGPAKAAIVGSAFFGTLSGSGVANTAATGSVTIPLMKSIGYKPEFAGAVEAVASNGGQIMPPVMGASAFIMAEILGIPYLTVCLGALVPALLYYFALFIQVDLEATRTGLKGIPRAQVPSVRKTLKEGWIYVVPVAGLIVLLAAVKFTPQMSGLWAIIILILVSMFNKETRLTPKRLIAGLENGAKSMLIVGAACAVANVIVASISVTGIGVRLSSILIDLAGGSIIILLGLAAITCFIMGMGLPTVGIYIIMAILVAPALVKMGIYPLAAHLFTFYWGLTSMITPPVAIVAYVAAGIAGSDWWKTGWTAMRLGVANYIVPFIFVFSPALVMHGSKGEILLSVLPGMLGIAALAIGLEGYLIRAMNRWQRILIIVGSLLLLYPISPMTKFIAVPVLAVVVFWNIRSSG